MELYDLIFLAMVVVFGFWGYTSGALRQIINFAAFFLGLIVAAASRGFLARTFNLDNLTSYIAVGVLFVALFVGLRLLGGALSDSLHKQKGLGQIDRIAGAGIGILWTLLILGAFHLIFVTVMPIGSQSMKWFRDAKVFPLTAQCAKTIQALLPQGAEAADQVADEV